MIYIQIFFFINFAVTCVINGMIWIWTREREKMRNIEKKKHRQTTNTVTVVSVCINNTNILLYMNGSIVRFLSEHCTAALSEEERAYHRWLRVHCCMLSLFIICALTNTSNHLLFAPINSNISINSSLCTHSCACMPLSISVCMCVCVRSCMYCTFMCECMSNNFTRKNRVVFSYLAFHVFNGTKKGNKQRPTI